MATLKSVIIRLFIFGLIWSSCAFSFSFAYSYYVYDVEGAMFITLSAFQLPLILIVYAVFDYLFKEKFVFVEKPVLVIPVMLLVSAILYFPLNHLIVFIIKVLN